MSALRGRGSRSRIQRGRSRPTGEKRDSKPVESKLTQRIYQNQGDLKVEYASTSGTASTSRRFAFENDVTPNEIEPLIQHEISNGCFIQYLPSFFNKDDEDYYFDSMLRSRKAIPFHLSQTESSRKLYCYYADQLSQNSKAWPTVVKEIHNKLISDEMLKSTYPNIKMNTVTSQLYRFEKDTDCWSTDQTNQITVNAVFGDVRRIKLKRKNCDDQFQVTLFAGSILILSGNIQHDWHIELPTEYHDREATIVLSFHSE